MSWRVCSKRTRHFRFPCFACVLFCAQENNFLASGGHVLWIPIAPITKIHICLSQVQHEMEKRLRMEELQREYEFFERERIQRIRTATQETLRYLLRDRF